MSDEQIFDSVRDAVLSRQPYAEPHIAAWLRSIPWSPANDARWRGLFSRCGDCGRWEERAQSPQDPPGVH